MQARGSQCGTFQMFLYSHSHPSSCWLELTRAGVHQHLEGTILTIPDAGLQSNSFKHFSLKGFILSAKEITEEIKGAISDST